MISHFFSCVRDDGGPGGVATGLQGHGRRRLANRIRMSIRHDPDIPEDVQEQLSTNI